MILLNINYKLTAPGNHDIAKC